ncbi:unnamed protein product [Lepeophtheirus salmonis]|uniref:(salmon louse) hypothetical protein n=1 Tax=Lepeophtheirus salmonis TaxID=72036 RepID=A0A7R8D203_LEPSM|nr:unnamed protein product [Lepeophtheirus salmonis]CAF2999962.1 unnamed protein product [Lepeophtheirus salmonis]
MVAVSAERCQAICHPLRERPPPTYYITFVVVISISLNARKYFEFQKTLDGDYETTSIMEYPPYIIFSTDIFQRQDIQKKKESSVHEHYRFIGGKRNRKAIMQPECSKQLRENTKPRNYETSESPKNLHQNKTTIFAKDSLNVKPNNQHIQSTASLTGYSTPTNGQKKLRKRHEKSVLILVLIVFVFLICHFFRLGVQIFQTFHSTEITKDHYLFCVEQSKLHVPLVFIILNSFNNLFLIINSSVNFIIYCAVRKSFRKSFYKILKVPFQCCFKLRPDSL